MNNTIKYLKIKKWLNHNGIQNYTINADYTIDVKGNVKLDRKGLTNFPDYIKFNKVGGNFDCDHNKFTSLEGAPNYIGGIFYCSFNDLTSLKGAPDHVGGDFYCYDNKLTSLEGAPDHVGGNFYCYVNKLTSLEGAPDQVGGNFYCYDNAKENLQLPKGTTVKGEYYNNQQIFKPEF